MEKLIENFKIDSKWIKWIMECITMAHSTILVNGSTSGEFRLKRGLRQGDPLSPLLFLLAAEVMSTMISKAVQKELYLLMKVGLDKVQISHMQFAVTQSSWERP